MIEKRMYDLGHKRIELTAKDVADDYRWCFPRGDKTDEQWASYRKKCFIEAKRALQLKSLESDFDRDVWRETVSGQFPEFIGDV